MKSSYSRLRLHARPKWCAVSLVVIIIHWSTSCRRKETSVATSRWRPVARIRLWLSRLRQSHVQMSISGSSCSPCGITAAVDLQLIIACVASDALAVVSAMDLHGWGICVVVAQSEQCFENFRIVWDKVKWLSVQCCVQDVQFLSNSVVLVNHTS